MRHSLFLTALFHCFLFSYLSADEGVIYNCSFDDIGKNGIPAGWNSNYIGNGNSFSVKTLSDSDRKALILEISDMRNSNPVGYGHCYKDIMFSDKSSHVSGTYIDITCWLKTENIVFSGESNWQGACLALDCYDVKNRKIQSLNISGMLSGTANWKKYDERVMVPAGTSYLRVMLRMIHCTGRLFAKDMEISYSPDRLALDNDAGVVPPYLIPEPRKGKYSGQLLKLGQAYIFSADKGMHPTNREELSEVITRLTGISPVFAEKEPYGKDSVIISRRNPYIEDYLKRHALTVSWEKLGNEGYFLYSGKVNGRVSIVLAANTDQGIFYALQTLKQLMTDEKSPQLYEAQITDAPFFKLRGLYTGPWWGPFKKGETDLVKRMNSYKMNFLHIGGIANNKIQKDFRTPFTEKEKEELRQQLEYCKSRFITLEPFLAPAQFAKPPITFSSEEDIGLLLKKIDSLCEIGFKDFSLCFDDLSNTKHDCLYNESDKKTFRNYGHAHASLIKRVYEHLKAKGKEYMLRCTLTTYYHGENYWTPARIEYISELNNLPADIPFFVCQSGFSDNASLEKYLAIAKRKPVLLGTWAAYERLSKLPMILPGFGANKGQSSFPEQYKYADAITFLMLTPKQEDKANISFASSADFAWNPVAYDPEKSAARQFMRFIGSGDKIESVRKLNDLCLKYLFCPLPDRGSKQERLDFIDRVTKEMDTELDKLHGEKVYDALAANVNSIKGKYALLKDAESKREKFPFEVTRCLQPPKIDGVLEDPCWENASSIPKLFASGKDLKFAEPATAVKLAYDDNNLYIAFICDEPAPEKIKAQFTRRNDLIFHDDCVEIFLDIRQNREMLHIAVNSNNALYDAKSGNDSWHGNYVSAVKKFDKTWQVEIAVPFKILAVENISPGTRWNINLCRERHSQPPVYSTWAYLPTGGFRQPYRFETIEFK